MSNTKEKTHFYVNDVKVVGYFHRPSGTDNKSLPVVVMFNGFATEWHFGTQAYIDAFNSLGLATFNFDYRGFGDSESVDGLRQLLDIPGQLDDCRAAMEHVKSQPWVDDAKLVVWGSSLGGGHAISIASEYALAAMIAQVPHCCSHAAFKRIKLSAVLKGMSLAIADKLGGYLGKKPIYLPVVAQPERYGVMNHPHWEEHYLNLAAGSHTWKNQIVARSLLLGGNYRPMLVASKITCPSLLVAGELDAGVPIESVKQTAQSIPNSECYTYNGDHFEVYHGEKRDDIIRAQLDFLRPLVCE